MNGQTGPRLLLIRHGQTDANLAHALDSLPPGLPLNSTGLAQAEAVARRLADQRVVAVYASLATRAQQTAAPIAARHDLTVEIVPDIQEVFCGDLEGRADHEAQVAFAEVYRRWISGDLDPRLPGGESAAEVRARFLPAATRLWRRHLDRPDGVVVLVSHGGAIRMAAGGMLGGTVDTRYVPNTGRVELAPAPELPGGWRLARWDTPEDADVPVPAAGLRTGEAPEGPGEIPGDVTGGAPPE
ncbi:MAG: histidine phosphatase family protein [Pseudonocardia sp.]